MRIRIIGKGDYLGKTLEYDCLHSTTVMMVKVYINVSFVPRGPS